MSNPITFHDKVLAHLYNYMHIRSDIQYGAPFEITQDGIAMILGITRSHVSIVIGKMISNEEVCTSSSSIRNSPKANKRMVYHLTDKGVDKYFQRKDDLMTAGYDIQESIEDGCLDEKTFRKMSLTESRMLGCFSVLRSTVNRSSFPGDIPFTGSKPNGEMFLREGVREKLMSFATTKDLISWHSAAADWCLDNGAPLRERLYHLNRSKRDREGVRVVKLWKYDVMDEADKEVCDIILQMMKRHSDPELAAIASQILLDTGQIDRAWLLSAEISSLDRSLSSMIRTEILLKKGRFTEALALAEENGGDSIESLTVLGKCHLMNRRFAEARNCFLQSREMMEDARCVFRMDDLHMFLSICDLGLEDHAGARINLTMALMLNHDGRRIKKMTETWRWCLSRLGSEYGILLEGVDIGDVQIPDVLDVPLEHREPLESESPGQDGRLDPEWCKDLGSEHTCASELHPFAVEEDLYLQRWLGVREVCGADADLVESHL